MHKIAILTSGGDSPGMNCAIRSVTRYGSQLGIEIIGVSRGYQGMLENKFTELGPRDVSNIISRGGTILKTARSQDFMHSEGRRLVYNNLKREKIEGFIVIGGNGSFKGAHVFNQEYGFPVLGIPATIDNDINGTERSLGFDTALNTALEAIDKIRDTATSMDRIFLIEVMGRHSGAIAVHSALSGGAEDIIMPDEKRDMDDIVKKIELGRKTGKKSWIIIVAEGSGWTLDLAAKLKEFVEEVRVTVIGHIQRGGRPSAFDRFLGAVFGKAALDALLQGKTRHVIGWQNHKTAIYPIEDALKPKNEDFSEFLELIKVLT